MAVARNSVCILDTGHVAVCIAAGAGGTQVLKDVTEEGMVETIAQADADAQQATAAATPAGAPLPGSEVFISKSSTQAPSTGSQIWFVDGYFTTTDGGAVVKAILTNAGNPLLKVAVPASGIVGYPAH